jgi:RimJ/RimL family protein N-acetyltransferase
LRETLFRFWGARKTKVLKTERLLLRSFALADAEAMYRGWASDPEVTRFLTWPAHASPEVSAKVLAEERRERGANSLENFAEE